MRGGASAISFPGARAHALRALSWCALAALALSVGACNLDNPGDDPPDANIYFPTAIAVSSATATQPSRFLYVVNSNFDLRYNAGSVQAYALAELDRQIKGHCKKDPGIACEIAADDVLADEVWISSYATGIAQSPKHDRLYVPTRAAGSLTYIEVDESSASDVLSCGESGRRPQCDADHERGEDSVQNGRRLRMPGDPTSVQAGLAADLVAAGEPGIDGDFVMVGHREGQVSLFLDEAEGAGKHGPLLTDVLSGMPRDLTGFAYDVASRLAYASVLDQSSSGGAVKTLGTFGVAVDAVRPEQSFLYVAGSLDLIGIASIRDTRAIAFHPSLPGVALVVSRAPSALLWVDVTSGASGPELARTQRVVPVGAGASRLALGTVAGIPVAVVSCFDARQIFVVHAVTGSVLSIVHNLSGPFELAIDEGRMRLYVADFRASVVRVIDLSPIAGMGSEDEPTSANTIATLGSPKLIQELQ